LRLRLHHAGLGRVLEALADSPEGTQCIKGLASAWGEDNSSVTLGLR
jgi:tRNA threonylcarbamoyladenosine biosynthesis protein TsaE